MKDQKYWQRRAVRYERDWNKRCAETVEKRLASHYEKALSAIKDDILQLYATFAKDNGLDFNEARRALSSREFREWRMSMREYIEVNDASLTRELNNLAMQPRITRLEKLYGETLQELDRLGRNVNDDMRNFLSGAYKDSYSRDIFDLVKVGGMAVAWAKVDSPSVEKVLAARWSGKNYSQRVWTNTRLLSGVIRETVATGVHRGLSISQLARQLEDKMHGGYSNAVRLVRTEMSFVNNQAHADSIEAAGIAWYEFIATLDNRTSAPCRSRDGEAYPLEKKTVGFNYPPLHPRCRSTVAPFIDGVSKSGTRNAKVGKDTIHIPASMSYRDYEAVYVKKTQTFEQWQRTKKNDTKMYDAPTDTSKKITPTEEQLAIRRYLFGKSPQPSASSQNPVVQNNKNSDSVVNQITNTQSKPKKTNSLTDINALKQFLLGKSPQTVTSNATEQTPVAQSGKSSTSTTKQKQVAQKGKSPQPAISSQTLVTQSNSKKITPTEEQLAMRRWALGITSSLPSSSTSHITQTAPVQTSKSSTSATKQPSVAQSGKSNEQATFKQQIERLRQKLEQQRASGASQAEMEKTIKEAGKLIVEQVKKIKPFDVSADIKLDRNALVQTWNDFMTKFKTIEEKGKIKEYMALRPICKKLDKEFDRYVPIAENQIRQIQLERAKQLKDILSQVRQMGATKEQISRQFGSVTEEARAIMESILPFYPTSWVEASIKHGKLNLENLKEDRSVFDIDDNTIHLNHRSCRIFASAIHEYAHNLESSIRELYNAEATFYTRRTAGEKLRLLSELDPVNNYEPWEYARKDKFLAAYMGKECSGMGFELASVGFQWAYTDPLRLLQDEDMANWIYGLLAIL